MTVTWIRLDQIRIDGETQARARIDPDAVAEYADQLMEGAALPPAVVFREGAEHWLADGFHRYHANRKIGAITMPAEVLEGTLHDAKLHAYAANKTHGLRRTNEDKRKAVMGMLALVPDWSDRAIADHVGVSDKTVASQRPAHCGDSAVTTEAAIARTYTTKHGTIATMDTSGQRRAAKDRKAKPAVAQAAAPTAHETPEDDGPSAEEIAEARRAAEDDAEEVRLLLESDDKLAAMTEKCKQQAALIRTLQERIRGLTNEAAQAIRLAKSWRTKFEKLEKAAA